MITEEELVKQKDLAEETIDRMFLTQDEFASRRERRAYNQRLTKSLKKSGPKMQSQILRFDKTRLWCQNKTNEELMEMVGNRKLDNYPAVQLTIGEAADAINSGVGLQSTGISNTDKNAIAEVFRLRVQKQKEENNNQPEI